MSNVVSEAIARPTRTAAQMAPSAVVTELLDIFVYDFDERGYAAVFAAITLLFGWVQVSVENYKGKAFLRKVPPTDTLVVDGSIQAKHVSPEDRNGGGI